jgi:hypothetical protein
MEDPDIRACWDMVVRGLEVGWLDAEELRSLIEHLRDGATWHRGAPVRAPRRSVAVSFLDDETRCSPAALLGQLEELTLDMLAKTQAKKP